MKNNKFTEGQRVHYTRWDGAIENGVVKTKHSTRNAWWVVYNCGGNWDDYRNYTGALTFAEELKDGWI